MFYHVTQCAHVCILYMHVCLHTCAYSHSFHMGAGLVHRNVSCGFCFVLSLKEQCLKELD